MQEYIERKYLEDVVDYYLNDSNGAEHYAYGIIKDEVESAPAADVVKVVRGRWEYWAGHLAKCSVCGYEYTDLLECDNYCGNCGAKMGE